MESVKFDEGQKPHVMCAYFTAVELLQSSKFYAGAVHKVLVNEKGLWRDYGKAEVVSVRAVRLHQLNDFICGVTFGMNVSEVKQHLAEKYQEEVKDMNKQEFVLVLYKKVRDKVVQNKMF